VRLAGGLSGGGGKDTRVGSQLLGGNSKVGGLKAAKGTGTKVRGRVRRAPKRAIRATGGVLDRGAIQKVVNSHMARIQRCYESQLLKNPGLAGKIVFDWVIAPSGRVASARQVSSSVRSPSVATCILAQIKSWRFPKPVGGSVQVRYPFVFRIQGF
jgi:outer membrane biosynthesis protein TonB